MTTWITTGIFLSLALLAVLSLFYKKPNNLLTSFVVLTFSLFLLLMPFSNCPGLQWEAPAWLSIGSFPMSFRMDSLSALFLILLGTLSLATALFSPGYLSHLSDDVHQGRFWSAFILFLLSMALVILSADAITFIVFWELMSLTSAALVGTDYRKNAVQRAAIIYLGSTRVATGFIAAGFLWMNCLTHSSKFADWRFDQTAAIAPAALLMLGFAIKAGIWPFHIWLPYAHPAAPSTVSSLMSGIMIKVALYAIIRILVLGDLNCLPIAYTTLAVATISVFWGMLFAIVQTDLKRILAYSSVENVGLILMGIALCLVARTEGLTLVASIAIAAALFHCIVHSLLKAMLFLSAGAVDAATHTRELGNLGGLARKMPWTMGCFILGGAAACALPPLNGFASKWLIYQSVWHSALQSASPADRGLALALMCILSLVGGLSLACFTNAVGNAFLGMPRSTQATNAKEGTVGMTSAQLFLASGCILTTFTVPQILHEIEPLCDVIVHSRSNLASSFNLPANQIAVALVALFCLIWAVVLNPSKVRKYMTWECGFGSLSPRSQVTSDSFTQPMARIFSPILRYTVKCDIQGHDRKHFPEHIEVAPQTVSLLEQRVYAPALNIIAFLARGLAKLQAGSIHLYLVYLCVTLVALLLFGTRL